MGLEKRDVLARTRELHIQRAVKQGVGGDIIGPPKWGKTRYVDIPPNLWPVVERLLTEPRPAGHDQEVLLRGPRTGKRWQTSSLSVRWHNFAVELEEKAGIKARGLHCFRHTYATLMAESVTQNPFVLKEILGHKRISTTEQYCHPTAPVITLPVGILTEKGGRQEWTQRKRHIKMTC